MRIQITILDILLVLSCFGAVTAAHTIPSKPKELWNTEFFPYEKPSEIPPEFVDESKGGYVEHHGVSTTWSITYENGVDLFHRKYQGGWNSAVLAFLNDELEDKADAFEIERWRGPWLKDNRPIGMLDWLESLDSKMQNQRLSNY